MNQTNAYDEDIAIHSDKAAINRRGFLLTSAAALSFLAIPSANAAQSREEGSLLEQGRQYNEGIGVAVDYKRAAGLFKRAAEVGSAEGKAWLGSMYMRGRGVTQDGARAVELINASAAAEDPVGLRFAGVLYQEGKAVPLDLAKARSYYERSAAKGDAVAKGRLGMLYLFGKGVQKNVGKAKEYLLAGSRPLAALSESSHTLPSLTYSWVVGSCRRRIRPAGSTDGV